MGKKPNQPIPAAPRAIPAPPAIAGAPETAVATSEPPMLPPQTATADPIKARIDAAVSAAKNAEAEKQADKTSFEALRVKHLEELQAGRGSVKMIRPADVTDTTPRVFEVDRNSKLGRIFGLRGKGKGRVTSAEFARKKIRWAPFVESGAAVEVTPAENAAGDSAAV